MALYFNQENRQQHLVMLLLWSKLQEWAEDCKMILPKERSKLLDAGQLILEASNSMIQRMNAGYAKTLSNSVNNIEMLLVNHANEAMKEKAGYRTVREDDIYDLAERVMDLCLDCKHPKTFHECTSFQAMANLDIPVVEEDTEWCPYFLDRAQQSEEK